MELKDMTIEQLEQRKGEIREAVEVEGADLDALETEARSINEEIESRKAAETKRSEIRAAVAAGEGEKIENFEQKEERKTMTFEEVRSSKEYINAFANYIKTENADECRALLTKNSSVETNPGQLPVPTIIEGRIRTAWQRAGLMDLVRKTYIAGNVQVGFELSAGGALVHEEGEDANPEEELTLGVVTMIPQSIKKWITISDEALDMGGEEFLYYIYDEVTYQIAKKAEDMLVAMITAASVASATAVGVPSLTGNTAAVGTVASLLGLLSDEATNPVVVMNKQTYSAFKAAQYAANYPVDPFEGLPVYFNNTLPAVTSATTGQTWLIVGDFGHGAQANFPNGEEIGIKYDALSLAEKDLVKIVGRKFVGLGLVADKAFAKMVVA